MRQLNCITTRVQSTTTFSSSCYNISGHLEIHLRHVPKALMPIMMPATNNDNFLLLSTETYYILDYILCLKTYYDQITTKSISH